MALRAAQIGLEGTLRKFLFFLGSFLVAEPSFARLQGGYALGVHPGEAVGWEEVVRLFDQRISFRLKVLRRLN